TADLRLTEAAPTPASTVAGQNLTYSLKVDDLGPSSAKNVVVKDTLPAGVTVQSVTSSVGSCTAGAPGDPLNPTTCALGTVLPTDHPTMTVVVRVLADTVGPLSYSARVSSATFDGNNANNLSTATTNVIQQADLGTAMTASPATVLSGRTLTYKTTVSNAGPSVARNVTVTQNLPSGVSFTAYHLVGGTGSCALLTPSQVGCALDTLLVGQSVDIYVDTLVAPSVPKNTVLTSNATAATSATDTAPGNNTASASGTADTLADLSIVNTSDAATYKPSTVIHYNVTVSNAGPSDAQNVVVTIKLPGTKIATYKSNSLGCPAPTGNTSGQTFTCGLGTIGASGSKTFQLNIYISGNKGLITSTATVTSTTADPNSANNSAIRNVTIK
ncbi:MAG: DUF11 domain-containing protein, partial [Frankiales bacterium]|nr:DUF11 domain-containing protein [Frankiales bacterium]